MPSQTVIPAWLKSLPGNGRGGAEDADRHDLSRSPHLPISLREVAEWDVRWQRILFRILVPVQLLATYDIDPVTLTDPQGRPVAFSRLGGDRGSFRLEFFPSGDAVEPLGEIELADTLFNQIAVVWVALQDPAAPRFDIDVMPGGEPTLRGSACRNLQAEEAALLAGLAPGQIRQGLRASRWLMERVEALMLCLNQREFIVQPLYYHLAVLFEQLGFAYIQGQTLMEEAHAGFSPGGALRARLDGSTGFRRPEQADTVRGRSWAIHDGILHRPWDNVRLVKRLGILAGVNTCPGIAW